MRGPRCQPPETIRIVTESSAMPGSQFMRGISPAKRLCRAAPPGGRVARWEWVRIHKVAAVRARRGGGHWPRCPPMTPVGHEGDECRRDGKHVWFWGEVGWAGRSHRLREGGNADPSRNRLVQPTKETDPERDREAASEARVKSNPYVRLRRMWDPWLAQRCGLVTHGGPIGLSKDPGYEHHNQNQSDDPSEIENERQPTIRAK